MKNYLIGTSLLFGSLIAAPVLAEDDFYLSIGAGIAYPSDAESDYTISGTKYDITEEMENGGLFSLGIGKEFGSDFRVEFNLSRSTISSDSFTVTSGGTGITGSVTPALEYDVTTYMVYGFADFPSDSKFTPYAGLGAGFASVDGDDQIATILGTTYAFTFEEETVFTYALKGGIGYEVSDQATLFTELTYQSLGSFESEGDVNYDANNFVGLTAGVRFTF